MGQNKPMLDQRKIFNQFYGPLVRFAFKMIKDQAQAEDIVIISFNKFFEIYTDTDARNVLYKMVRNACIDYIRSPKNKTAPIDEQYIEYISDDNWFILELTIKEEQIELIRKAIQTLPDKEKQIITLSLYSGLSDKQIADKLGIAVQTVYTSRNRTINKFKNSLQ